MTGADEIRAAVGEAKVLRFPRLVPEAASTGGASSAAAGNAASSSRSGGSAGGPAAEDGGGAGRGDGGDREGGRRSEDIEFGFCPMTDLGNAERFAGRYKHLLRYCPAIGWLAWDGRRWSREGADEAVKRAEHATARSIQDEAEAIADTPGVDFQVGGTETNPVFYSDKLKKWGRATEGAQRLASMSKRACAMLSIAVSSLDRDPMKIAVLNGTLRVGREIADGFVALGPHEPEDYITRLAPVVYDPEATSDHFDRFLEEIQPNPRMRSFLHAWFGYSLTGDTGEQKMVFFYGTGRNGKGVLVNLMAHVAGGYADSIAIESFMDSGKARAGGQATPDLADLPGVRLLSTSEPKKGAKLDEALIKLFTGGDPIKARHLNKGFFSFVPQAKLTMQGNYKPGIRDNDEGMWSRVKLIPFGVTVPKEKRDPKLFDKLKGEASGILNRLLDGLRAWLDAGVLVFPEEVDEATAQYRSECDPIGRFLDECTAKAEDGRVQATRMHEVFAAWAKANGETVYSAKGLGGALLDRGLKRKKSDASYWIGIRMTKSTMDYAAAPNGGAAQSYVPPGDLPDGVEF